MNRRGLMPAAAFAALALGLTAAPSGAQVNPVLTSPIPAGLAAGKGAPFPKGHFAALDALPDWGGVWTFSFSPRPVPGAPRPPPPPLKGKYLAEYQAWRAAVVANGGVVKRTGSNCMPPGMPGIMTIGQYPIEFLFTPGRVTVLHEAWMQVRRIWTDGRVHDDPEPGFHGHSVGRWEGGDTLVVDTTAIKDSIPLGMGMSHSDKLHVTERIHLAPGDADTLLDEITVDDPEALEHAYTTVASYKRDRYGVLLEFVCAENDRNQVDDTGNTTFQ